ncbi:MAG TPA: hypothetical protein VMB22_03065 [Verrucomicrobiae bacterium]|nr:hypothetical protein [Verrucomicrobiae bacterium]
MDETGLTNETEFTLPPPGKWVLVQCDDFRCMAYRTPDGKWMPAYGDREITSPVRAVITN